MKIGINAICFNDRPSGAKQRFIGIYKELFKHLNNDEIIVYEPSDCQISSWFDKQANVVFKQTPLLSHSRLLQYYAGLFYWRNSLMSEKFDIFEQLHLPLVKAPTGHTILTVHDIRGIILKGNWRERLLYKTFFKRSLMAADHVITVSESIRNEILDLYPKVPISVIYNGIDIEAFENIPELKLLKVQQKFNLPEDFLLSVGHFEKRKNYLNLIDAVNRLHRRGHSMFLVIIGHDSGEMDAVKEKIHSLNLTDYVKILSNLTNLEVRCIYSLCKLFVFPSSYEGFGIPILEAMAAKRPIVLSNIPVFQEITQGRGVYFSHNDSDSIASAIDKVFSSTSESDRLIEYGNKKSSGRLNFC